MAKSAAERLPWAVETLAVGPDDSVLEIGCGAGAAVSLVCKRLIGGKIVAIDRSEAMAKMARKRNHEAVASGKARVDAVALDQANFGSRSFDKVFAFNVALFWKPPVKELASIRKWLKPEGRLYLFHQPPLLKDVDARKYADRLAAIIRGEGLAVRRVLIKDMKPAPAFCVIGEIA